MTAKFKSDDPDIRGSLPAIKRAARRARELAARTGTPIYVLIKGKIVNLNPKARRLRAKSKRST
ncbi:MAG: hypothetical protein HY719_02375 [Planctomycetes bacterium]|nr:hypothetical protein [Planctomycetota bacterium]